MQSTILNKCVWVSISFVITRKIKKIAFNISIRLYFNSWYVINNLNNSGTLKIYI